MVEKSQVENCCEILQMTNCSPTPEVIKCKDQKPGEKMGQIQRSRDQEIQRSRDQNRHQPVDPEQEIDQ